MVASKRSGSGICLSTSHHVEVVIVGGGICGLLAAQNCVKRGLSFHIIERESEFGGNWVTKANSYSQLQVRGTVCREGGGPPQAGRTPVRGAALSWRLSPCCSSFLLAAPNRNPHFQLPRTRRTSRCIGGTARTA